MSSLGNYIALIVHLQDHTKANKIFKTCHHGNVQHTEPIRNLLGQCIDNILSILEEATRIKSRNFKIKYIFKINVQNEIII